jgi:hypothetical protein
MLLEWFHWILYRESEREDRRKSTGREAEKSRRRQMAAWRSGVIDGKSGEGKWMEEEKRIARLGRRFQLKVKSFSTAENYVTKITARQGVAIVRILSSYYRLVSPTSLKHTEWIRLQAYIRG